MNHSSSSLFHPIEPSRTPWSRWLTSLGVHFALALVLIAIPVAVDRGITSHYAVVRLEDPRVSPSPAIKAPVIKVRIPELVIPHAPIKTAPILLTRLTPPVKPAKPLPIEPPPVIRAPEQVRVMEPKFEIPALVASPKPTVVRTEVFAAVNAAPALPKPVAREVKPGGFGDPEGVPPSTATSKGLAVAKVGAFDLPSGTGQGGAAGHGKVVAMAGFGGGGSNGDVTGNRGDGAVHSSGFGDYAASPVPAVAARTAAPSVSPATPVEITYKPKPVYTPEAREQKIEGEVQLDVVFSAAGQVHVLRVVRGLGLGLDESARAAASQIRFHPSTKDGSPVDMRGIVHIVFELS